MKKTYKEILNEMKQSYDIPFSEIEKLVDLNNHTEARLIGAEALKNKNLIKMIKTIQKDHIKAGNLTDALKSARDTFDKEMFSYAKKVLNKKDYKRFYNSF
jgi:uncharacterized protein HemY